MLPSIHSYHGNSTINFVQSDQGALHVTIETERLLIRSVEASDIDSYVELFESYDVMCKFGTGVKTRVETETRIREIWLNRWKENNPYSGLAVFKKDTHEFIGHVIAGHGDAPGLSEVAYLFLKAFWGQGYGTEATRALVKECAPATIREGYKVEGEVLYRLTSTVRPDNPGSVRVLQKVGVHKVGEEERFGAVRYSYAIDMAELMGKV